MKVWIDLDNSPHVPFFTPIIRRLERDGIEVVVTARAFSQTEELAASQGLKFVTVGEHNTPRHFVTRATATVWRAARLASHVSGAHADVAVSHGSRGMVLAAWMLGIPSMTLYDYEFVSSRVYNQLSARIMAPSVVDFGVLRDQGLAPEKFIHYPGLKEEVYVYDFRPDERILSEQGLDPTRLIVTIRPHADWAHYYGEHSEQMFSGLVERLRHEPGVQVVVLPRTAEQRAKLISRYAMDREPFKMMEHAVDALSLMWYSDAVFSGGGTMVREAALLGVKVYSFFGGKLGSADQSLVSSGRLKLLQSPVDVQNLRFAKTARLPVDVNGKRETRDFIYNQIRDFAMSQANRKRKAA